MDFCSISFWGLGTASRNRGGVDRVRQDWSTMKSYINDLNLFGISL